MWWSVRDAQENVGWRESEEKVKEERAGVNAKQEGNNE